MIRHELLNLTDLNEDAHFNVLEVGCATGATLLEIKNKYKNANVYGIELNKNAAAIAQKFIDVRADDIEKTMSYEENYFDYIIFGDVLEHLYDPWYVLDNMRKYLKPEGRVIISIPNVMHYSALSEVLNGGWKYQDAGILDRTHVRFFTLKELKVMLENAYYTNTMFQYKLAGNDDNAQVLGFINKLTELTSQNLKEQYKAYQYLIVANKCPDELVVALKKLSALVENVELASDEEESIVEVNKLLANNEHIKMELINAIIKNSIEPVKMLQKLGLKSFEMNEEL